MSNIDEIISFLEDLSGIDPIDIGADIFADLGVVGDDFHEMIEKFASKFAVDMTNYLWYFHTDEEGQSFGGLFFKPPNKQVERIPVTPTMLLDFANKGKWDIQYPNHEITISTKRYDLLINKISLGVFLLIVLISTVNKCSK